MLPDICTRPEVGRITGRGNTANLEVVLALKPDLILDVGSTAPTFVSLADARAGADRHPLRAARRPLRRHRGGLPQARRADAASRQPRCWRVYADARWRRSRRGCRHSGGAGRGSTTRAGRAGSRPGSADRSTSRPSSSWRAMSPPNAGRAGDRLDRAGAAVEPGRDHHHRPRFRRELPTIRPGRRQGGARRRVHLSPKCRSAGSTFRPRVNRLIGLWWLARILYPELFPGGPAGAHARLLHALLSRDAERRADRAGRWRDG